MLERIRPQVLVGMLIMGMLAYFNQEIAPEVVVGIAATMNLLVKPGE